MPDRRPQVSQVRSYVSESGFLERKGRRTVQHPAAMSRIDVIKRRLRIGS
jgi:hypothetical protein